jgi:hypothetical protein
MSLEEKTQHILDDFESTASDKIIETLNEIKFFFKSELTRDYLQGKIDAIAAISNEDEKKNLCKNLIPYLDWYLQGV